MHNSQLSCIRHMATEPNYILTNWNYDYFLIRTPWTASRDGGRGGTAGLPRPNRHTYQGADCSPCVHKVCKLGVLEYERGTDVCAFQLGCLNESSIRILKSYIIWYLLGSKMSVFVTTRKRILMHWYLLDVILHLYVWECHPGII